MSEKHSKDRSVFQIDEHLLIGRGGVRQVYHHPGDADKCIKLVFNKNKRRAVAREEQYLRRYWTLGKPFTHLSRFYGRCCTSLGPGGIFQLIRDYDGAVSQALPAFLPGSLLTKKLPPTQIATMLRQLHQHLVSNAIIVSDPAPGNIVVNFLAPDHPKLVLIDGIGNPHFLKAADHLKCQAKKIIDKKWKYYIEDNPLLVGVL